MLEYEFENSVGYWVVTAAHAMQRALNEELAPYGMTHRQWQVLCWLAIDGTLAQNELAERMNIEPATLVSVLARMERHGWIGRRVCPNDARRRLVFPKSKAKPIWEKGVQCAHRVRERATKGFTVEDRERLKHLLAAMLGNLREDGSPQLEEELIQAEVA